MYTQNVKDVMLNVYNTLLDYNIKGRNRINFINTIFNGHINTIYNWKKENNNVNNNVQNNNIRYRNKKVTEPIELFIMDTIRRNPIITVKTIKFKILELFGVELHKSTIYSVLKHNKFTYKCTKKNTNPNSIEEQRLQLQRVKSVIDYVNIDNIVSIDETSIELSSKPSRGWSLKGTKCNIRDSGKKIIKKKYSLVMAVSNSKIIDFHIKKKSIKGKDYLKFLKKLKRRDPNGNNTYLMDNCTAHRSNDLMQYYKEQKMHVLFNVPYHSETNPIETVFSILKNTLNRTKNDTYEDIVNVLRNFRTTITEEKLSNIFNYSFGLFNQLN